MELPKLSVPIYTATLPSTGQKIRVRPFFVKEEKLLLIAKESGDPRTMIEVTKQIITNCLVDNDLNVSDLPFFDIDYLFLLLRAKSIGETVEMNFVCNNKVDEEKCGAVFPVELDILKATLSKNETIEEKVWLNDSVGVKFKYPKYAAMKMINDDLSPFEQKMKIVENSIDYIFDKEKTYSSKEIDSENLQKFIEGLTQKQMNVLENWVNNLPYFEIRTSQTCPKCNFNHEIKFKDFTSFFQ